MDESFQLPALQRSVPRDLLIICPQHPPTHIFSVTVRGEGDIKENGGAVAR